MTVPTPPTPQEAVTGWIIIGTIGCFVCALACIASDHMLPWIAALWRRRHDERWTNYEDRCGVNESCVLRQHHRGQHEEKDFD